MKFTFLGTSSGTPTRDRNVSGLAVGLQNNKLWLLIDCGEGTQHRLLQTSYALRHLAALLITHVHGDHSFGLPGLLTTAALQGRQSDLTVVAPREIEKFILASMKTSASHLTYAIGFVDVSESDLSVDAAGLRIQAVPLSHRVPSFAFALTEAQIPAQLDIEKLDNLGIPRGPIWGELQAGKDVELDDGRLLPADDFVVPPRPARKIVVGGDNDRPELLAEACKGASLLVHESIYSEEFLTEGNPSMHSSAQRVARFAASVPGLDNLVLTHFSARYQANPGDSRSIEDIWQEARQAYAGQLFLAADLQEYHLLPGGELQLISSPELVPNDA